MILTKPQISAKIKQKKDKYYGLIFNANPCQLKHQNKNQITDLHATTNYQLKYPVWKHFIKLENWIPLPCTAMAQM